MTFPSLLTTCVLSLDRNMVNHSKYLENILYFLEKLKYLLGSWETICLYEQLVLVNSPGVHAWDHMISGFSCSFLYLASLKIFIRIHKTTKLLFMILRGKKHTSSDFSPTATAGGIDRVQSWPATLDIIISMMSSNHWQRW